MRKTMVMTLLAATSFGLVTVGQAHAATTSYTTTFKYVDATTNKTLKTVKTTGTKNKTYTYKPVAIKYYATPAKLSYKVTKASTITLKVRATSRKVTVKYVDRYNNATIKPAKIEMAPVGKTASFTPVSISGYQVTSTATKKLANVKLDSTVAFTYDKLFKLTQNMVAIDTKKSLGTSSQMVRRGQTVTVTPTPVANYVTPAIQKVQVNKDTTATFNYQRLYNVTVNAVGSDGAKLGTTNQTVQQGKSVTVTPKAYPGYATPVSQKVTPTKDMTVTVTYPKFYTVNVVEKTADGTVLATRSMQGQAGQSVTVMPGSHAGYVTPDAQTMSKAGTVALLYQIDRSHQDDAYNKLIASVDNQNHAKMALAAYKADYTQAKTLAAYQVAQQVMSNISLTSLGNQAMRVVDSYDSDDISAGTKQGATDVTMTEGATDSYIAYYASGDYDWVVNQTTKQGAWVKSDLLTTDDVRNGEKYTYESSVHVDQQGTPLSNLGHLASYDVQYGINGDPDEAIVKVVFARNATTQSDSSKVIMQDGEFYINNNGPLIGLEADSDEKWTADKAFYTLTFTMDAESARLLETHTSFITYGIGTDATSFFNLTSGDAANKIAAA
ncbi:hypothetical protein [Weissella cibaria]|uniref:hypothetical protein n=1 Tax=Weissella cibaria TaxID=137591 RepID=UPI001319DCAD|nr:hypothetical protein [Weissella cibaria]